MGLLYVVHFNNIRRVLTMEILLSLKMIFQELNLFLSVPPFAALICPLSNLYNFIIISMY